MQSHLDCLPPKSADHLFLSCRTLILLRPFSSLVQTVLGGGKSRKVLSEGKQQTGFVLLRIYIICASSFVEMQFKVPFPCPVPFVELKKSIRAFEGPERLLGKGFQDYLFVMISPASVKIVRVCVTFLPLPVILTVCFASPPPSSFLSLFVWCPFFFSLLVQARQHWSEAKTAFM